MSADGTDLEDKIVSRFMENIDSNSDITAEVVDIMKGVSNESDFGGRDHLKDRILEVKARDED